MEHMVNGLQMKTFKTGRQVVDWKNIFQFTVDGHQIKVISNEMVVKVAKTSGKSRKERRLQVTIDGVNSIEIGTESAKKGSFIKRLLKVTKVIKKEITFEQCEKIDANKVIQECVNKGNIVDVEKQWHTFTNIIIDDCNESDFDLDEACAMLAM